MQDLTYNPETHEYHWRGKLVPSVTQVLKATGLIDDSWYSEESARRGQAVHRAVELDEAGTLDGSTVHPKVLPYLEAWRQFRRDTGYSSEVREYQVYHQSAQYAGTVDDRGILQGNKVILDRKTGGPQLWHQFQLAAYAMAHDEPRLYRRIRVQLKPDGSYKVTEFPISDLTADYNVFHCARFVYTYQTRRTA